MGCGSAGVPELPVLSPVCAGFGPAGHAPVQARVRGAPVAMVPLSWCPMVVARCGDGWSEVWSGGWSRAGLGPLAGEVGLAGQGGPAEDGGELCCLGSLAFPFGLDRREY